MPIKSRKKKPARLTPALAAAAAAAGRPPAPVLAGQVVLRRANAEIARITNTGAFAELAGRWRVTLLNRRQWAGSRDGRDRQAARAKEDFLALGIGPSQFLLMAAAGHVEVAIAADANGAIGAAARVPWEYMIASATSTYRNGLALLITRHLETGRHLRRETPDSLLFVISTPGELADRYVFGAEERAVFRSLGLDKAEGGAGIVSRNETLRALRKRLERKAKVIHFTGFDTAQAAQLVKDAAGLDPTQEGIAVGGDEKAYAQIGPEDIRTAAEMSRPSLVAFNCFNSGGTLAASAVLGGADGAIGFLNDIGDDVSETFFAAFYREWRASAWNSTAAFGLAWGALREARANLHGTCIVLWLAESAFAGGAALANAAPIADPVRDEAERLKLEAEDALPMREQFSVSCDIRKEINYSLLHNNQPIFRRLILTRSQGSRPVDVNITVELYTGTDSCPFRLTRTMGTDPANLTGLIDIPLVSSLSRALRERVQTTIFIKIEASDQMIFQETRRVTLLPIDEWSDDAAKPDETDPSNRNSVWLPSFVIPRDAAVGKIIDSAQRYLMAHADDPSIGFDGYQQVEAAARGRQGPVDAQVKALWHAISFECRLGYINPPPTYGVSTQRLRTPSDIINGRRGTCIDLALLVAACLEYVEIYPVIFLLKTHAFPGYWSSGSGKAGFLKALSEGEGVMAGAAPGQPAAAGWEFRRSYYRAIVNSVRKGDLVPLESVWLTNYSSFLSACEEGSNNLNGPREFESMLDVMAARQSGVTPIPILQSGGQGS